MFISTNHSLGEIMKQLFVTLLVITLTACASGSKNTQYALHNAIYKGNVSQAQSLINSGTSMSDRDSYGYTPLTAAAMLGKWDIAKVLIEKGVDINAPDGNGYTPLIYAAQSCDVGMVKYLVEHGADPSAKPTDGYSALFYATVECKDCDLGKYLLSLPNVDPLEQIIDSHSLYFWAMEYKNMGMVAAFRKRGITERYLCGDDGVFFEALRKPSKYTPLAGEYHIEVGKEKSFDLAVEDCNQLVVPSKKGLLMAGGPIGYGIGWAVDKVRIPGKFQQCMEVMGFKCLNNNAQ